VAERLPINFPLHLQLRPSRSAAIALMVIHGIAVAAIGISQINSALKLLLLLPLAFSLVWGLQFHAWRSAAGTVVELVLREAGGELELLYGNGHRTAATLDGSSTVLHWLMALRLRHEKHCLSLFLLPDMLDTESWRRLSILLRSSKIEDQAK
jgi:hypothetical protein